MKSIALSIIKSVLESANCEANGNVVNLYLEAFTDLDLHYDVEEIAYDNGLLPNICETINNNFRTRSIRL